MPDTLPRQSEQREKYAGRGRKEPPLALPAEPVMDAQAILIDEAQRLRSEAQIETQKARAYANSAVDKFRRAKAIQSTLDSLCGAIRATECKEVTA